MSHSHKPEHGFLNLEELDEAENSEDRDSTYSYSRSPSARRQEMIASRRIDAKVRLLGNSDAQRLMNSNR